MTSWVRMMATWAFFFGMRVHRRAPGLRINPGPTLPTAARWGISKLHALRDLFNSRAWLPPVLEPAG